MASDPNADIEKNEVEARQGSTRPKVIYVLIAGVILIVAVFFIISMFQTKTTGPT